MTAAQRRLRVGVAGAGAMGGIHAEAYSRMPDVELVGVAGATEADAKPLADRLGCPAHAGLDAMLDTAEIDVVDLSIPTPLHKPGVLAAARRGKHVICEKPLARTIEDCGEMIAACRDAGVHLLVGHVLRFFPQYVSAREAIIAGTIGEPVIARTFRGNGFPRGWQGWYADPAVSGGLLLDMVLHDFDWLRWTFGEVERVYAKGLVKDVAKGRDYALVTLRHRSGVLSHVEGTWCHTTPFNMKLEVAGDKGLIDYDDSRARPVTFTPRETGGASAPGVAVPESPLADDPYAVELRHFIDVIAGKADPIVTPEDAVEAIRIALAALESVETGRPVTLSS